jgi:hypothetical protein
MSLFGLRLWGGKAGRKAGRQAKPPAPQSSIAATKLRPGACDQSGQDQGAGQRSAPRGEFYGPGRIKSTASGGQVISRQILTIFQPGASSRATYVPCFTKSSLPRLSSAEVRLRSELKPARVVSLSLSTCFRSNRTSRISLQYPISRWVRATCTSRMESISSPATSRWLRTSSLRTKFRGTNRSRSSHGCRPGRRPTNSTLRRARTGIPPRTPRTRCAR